MKPETTYPAERCTGISVNSEGELFIDGKLVRQGHPEANDALQLWDFLAGQYRSFGNARNGGKFATIDCCAMPSVSQPKGKGSLIGLLDFEFGTKQNIEHEEGKLKGYKPEYFQDYPGEAEVLEAIKLLQADILEGNTPITVHDRLVPWPDRPHYYSLVLWAKGEHKDDLLPVAALVSEKIMADPVLNKAHERIG